MTEESRTAIPNEVYDLASVLYHALEGAQTYDKYAQDAGGNEQLTEFFRTAKRQDEQRAQEALWLLGAVHGQNRGGAPTVRVRSVEVDPEQTEAVGEDEAEGTDSVVTP